MGKHFEELMALWPELRKAGAIGGREGVVRVRGRKLPGGVVLFQLSVPSTSQVEAPRGCHQPHGFVLVCLFYQSQKESGELLFSSKCVR